MFQNQQTALHVASYFGHANIVLLLLESGASVDETTYVSVIKHSSIDVENDLLNSLLNLSIPNNDFPFSLV